MTIYADTIEIGDEIRFVDVIGTVDKVTPVRRNRTQVRWHDDCAGCSGTLTLRNDDTIEVNE